MYDYIIEKPELNEDTLAHYGVKGMKWKKHLKGKYYSLKSKAGEKITKKLRGSTYSHVPTNNYGTKTIKNDLHSEDMSWDTGRVYKFDVPTSKSGSRGSNVERGIAAGRERAKKRKKK